MRRSLDGDGEDTTYHTVSLPEMEATRGGEKVGY